MEHERKQLYAKKKKRKKRCPSLFLAANPSTFSRHTEKTKTKKKNVPMPGPRRVITFFLFCFFNSKSSVVSVCQREYVTG